MFGKNFFVTNLSGESAMAVDIYQKPLKKIWAQSELNSGLAGVLKFIKGFQKLYKGNYGQILFWPYFFTEGTHQCTVQTVVLHFLHRFHRHATWPICLAISTKPVWPFELFLAIFWHFDHTRLTYYDQMYRSSRMSTETAKKM